MKKSYLKIDCVYSLNDGKNYKVYIYSNRFIGIKLD